MADIPGITNGSSVSKFSSTTSVQGLTSDDFLRLMITQLQNQDPLNPTDDNALLQQVSEIRSIASSEQLTDTLETVQLGQNLAIASSLIGKHIQANSDDNQTITGVVDSVRVVGGVTKVNIGEDSVSLSNIIEIKPSE